MMIDPEREARMALSAAMDGGDPAVAGLVGDLGAQGAWNKIIEGALGDPSAERAARTSAGGGATGGRERRGPVRHPG